MCVTERRTKGPAGLPALRARDGPARTQPSFGRCSADGGARASAPRHSAFSRALSSASKPIYSKKKKIESNLGVTERRTSSKHRAGPRSSRGEQKGRGPAFLRARGEQGGTRDERDRGRSAHTKSAEGRAPPRTKPERGRRTLAPRPPGHAAAARPRGRDLPRPPPARRLLPTSRGEGPERRLPPRGPAVWRGGGVRGGGRGEQRSGGARERLSVAAPRRARAASGRAASGRERR